MIEQEQRVNEKTRNAVQKIENITLFSDVSLYGSHFLKANFFSLACSPNPRFPFTRLHAIVNISLSWSSFFYHHFFFVFPYVCVCVFSVTVASSIYTPPIRYLAEHGQANDQKTIHSFGMCMCVYKCFGLLHTTAYHTLYMHT